MILLWNGQHLPHYSVDASAITDLSLESATTVHPQRQHAQAPAPGPNPPHLPAQQQLVDPAILSFSKPPSQPAAQPPQAQPAPGAHKAHAPVAASLTEPFSNLELDVAGERAVGHGGPQARELQAQKNVTPTKQASRRNRRGNDDGFAGIQGAAASTNPKSKGWRQTAFVEPDASVMQGSSLVQPDAKLRKKKAHRSYAEDPSGWATEDATDIQELGDFDFQSNLSKFDKRRVFEEIRNDDTTADEARLVSFNRKAKPGTNGGKNLHWTENVLDSPHGSDSGEDVAVISDARHSGENISGRELSRASARALPSRKSSAVLGQATVPHVTALGRGQLNTSRTTSPRPGRSSVSPMVGPKSSGASLRLTTTNRSCPTVSPLQTLEVEQIAVAEFGVTEDIITENAGRGIAEAAVGLLANDAAAPTMLILTGNHRTGARAISAARHLRNRGHRVTVCMLGLEHEAELLENCRKHLEIFRKIGGRVLRWEDLSARLSTSELAPDLVIDALFGMHIAFDDLRTDDQAAAFEMISWVNRSNVEVLSVDIPSGISASTGTYRDTSALCLDSN